jgi:hypothetical protein
LWVRSSTPRVETPPHSEVENLAYFWAVSPFRND